MNFKLIVLMLLAAVGMIYGQKKYKRGKLWGQPMAIACAVFGLIFALMNFLVGGPEKSKDVIAREMAYIQVATEKLGQHIARTHRGGTAVIITSPENNANNEYRNRLITGLRRGLGNTVTIVDIVSPEIPESIINSFREQMGPGMPHGDDMPYMFSNDMWFTAEVMDNLLDKYEDVGVVISTMGLPMDVAAMRFWTKQPERQPKLALALSGIYELRNLRNAITAGIITAAVINTPARIQHDRAMPPRNLDEAFDKRYLLITPENVSDIAAEHQNLFEH